MNAPATCALSNSHLLAAMLELSDAAKLAKNEDTVGSICAAVANLIAGTTNALQKGTLVDACREIGFITEFTTAGTVRVSRP